MDERSSLLPIHPDHRDGADGALRRLLRPELFKALGDATRSRWRCGGAGVCGIHQSAAGGGCSDKY
ncbi:MAG: hypothetical protein AAGF23_18255 [Acidobacteriota bacterium]